MTFDEVQGAEPQREAGPPVGVRSPVVAAISHCLRPGHHFQGYRWTYHAEPCQSLVMSPQ